MPVFVTTSTVSDIERESAACSLLGSKRQELIKMRPWGFCHKRLVARHLAPIRHDG